MRRFLFLLLPALGLLLAACQSTAGDSRRMMLPLEANPDGTYAVRAEIDGQGPYRLILDTGSEYSALKTSHAARLDLPVRGESLLVHGLFSSRWAPITEDIDLQTGDLAVQLPVLVLDDEGYDGISADGLFGLESMGWQRTGARYAQIDLKDESLILSDFLTPSDRHMIERWTRLETDLPMGGKLLAFDILIDGVRGKALLDTGLRYSLINSSYAAALEMRGRTRMMEIVDAHGDEKRLRVASAPNLRAIGLRWPRVSVLVHDAAAFDFLEWNDEPAALVGVNMLQDLRLFIDTERGRITALPKAPRGERINYIAPRLEARPGSLPPP